MKMDNLLYTYAVDGAYKIDLPESKLEGLLSSVSTPFVMRLESPSGNVVYAGVREFSASEGCIGLSTAIATDLKLEIDDSISIEPVDIPKGTEITIKPLDNGSSSNVNYDHLLESYIPRTYTAMFVGMQLTIPYLGTDHKLKVTHLKPDVPAVCVIDTDMDLIIEQNAAMDSQMAYESVEFKFNAPMDIGSVPQLLSASVPENCDRLYIESSELVFIGPENATSVASFIAVTDSMVKEVSTIFLGTKFSIYGTGTVTVSASLPTRHEDTRVDSDNTVCPTCGKHIPQQSFLLHSISCARNTVKCQLCSRVFSGTKKVSDSHLQLHVLLDDKYTELRKCDECGQHFEPQTAAGAAFHRATTCAGKLHICQFCHLLVPQGDTTPVDAAQGLTAHESHCGSRTTDCPHCKKPIRLRSLMMHLKEHERWRQERPPPRICSNWNCPNVLPSNGKEAPFKLCPQCFGPLSAPGSNNDLDKVKQRIERRLILQLMRGCGKPWCLNQYCAVGGGKPKPAAEAVKIARELAESQQMYFCVDEQRTRRAMFVQLDADGPYARGWRGMAISACGSESEANEWLEKNANKDSGVQ